VIKYITNSVQNLQEEHKTYNLYDIPVHLIDSFTNDIDLNSVISHIEHIIPRHLLYNIDVVYVANIKDFTKQNRTFNAMYKDNAIYVSPEQDNEEDLLDDIVHEIAHSFEKEYYDVLYKDGELEREFLGKRNTLHYLVDKPTLNKLYYNSTEYNAKFDNHMYHDIGYDRLRIIASGLFYSPYAITSLREYWANGFENYLLGDRERLKNLSPILFRKVEETISERDTK
tara:strand:+ start:326 stop:1006 length:681 start_codon:yes stop_codon:yes gene_type:complete